MSLQRQIALDSPAFAYLLGQSSGSTVSDFSGNGVHATVNGAPTFNAGSLFGLQSMSFTGSGVYLSNSYVPNTFNWTWEFLLQIPSSSGNGIGIAEFRGPGVGAGVSITVVSGYDSGASKFLEANGDSNNFMHAGKTSLNMHDSVTRHVVITWAGSGAYSYSQLLIYVNGVLTSVGGGSVASSRSAPFVGDTGCVLGSHRAWTLTGIGIKVAAWAGYPSVLNPAAVARHFAAAVRSGCVGT